MPLVGKSNDKILLLSDAHKNSIFKVGSHHILRSLRSSGYNVSVISTPLSILNLFRFYDSAVKKRIISYINSRNLNDYYMSLNFAPYRLLRRIFSSEVSEFVSRPFSDGKAKGGYYDLVVVDSVELLPFLDEINGLRIVYRPTDIYSFASEYYSELEYKYVKDKNIPLICMSNESREYYIDRGFHVLGVISNGVSNSLYSDCQKLLNVKKVKKPSSALDVKFVYFGAIDDRLEVSFLEEIVDYGFSLSIYGTGNRLKDIIKNKKLNNCYKGVIDYRDIPKICTNFDVGVLPLSADKKNISRSPMKLYEYLACGLVVASNVESSYEEVVFLGGRLDFDKLNERIAKQKINDKLNLTKIAKDQTWDAKTIEIIGMIESYFRLEQRR